MHPGMKEKFDYIMNLFRGTYCLGQLSPDVTYGEGPRGLIHIGQGMTQCFETVQAADIIAEQVIWKTWLGEKIPFFFDSADGELFYEEDGHWIIRFDLIATSFFLLSGWQEYFSQNRDRYGRFQYEESVQARFGFTGLPVVNYYFDILRTVIEKAYHVSIKPVSADSGHPYTVCLTHDIYTCETAWLEGGFSAVKKKALVTPLQLLYHKLFR